VRRGARTANAFLASYALGPARQRPKSPPSGVQRSIVYGVLRKLEVDGDVKAQELPSGTKGWAIRANDLPAHSSVASAAASEPQADGQPHQGGVPAIRAGAADASASGTQRTQERAGEPSAS
jgi:hypothetical protein